jgi:hypothetical protein
MANPLLIDGAMNLFGSLINAIDDWHTSDEEKLIAKGQIYGIQAQTLKNILDFESERLNAQRDIIVAEAKGESWLQRNWRPLSMMVFVIIIANNFIFVPYAKSFGMDVPMLDIPEGMWTLLTVGIGGYIGGRTVEKVLKNSDVSNLFNKKKPKE